MVKRHFKIASLFQVGGGQYLSSLDLCSRVITIPMYVTWISIEEAKLSEIFTLYPIEGAVVSWFNQTCGVRSLVWSDLESSHSSVTAKVSQQELRSLMVSNSYPTTVILVTGTLTLNLFTIFVKISINSLLDWYDWNKMGHSLPPNIKWEGH